MDRRSLVKAAIAHQKTERVPYCIGFTSEAAKVLQEAVSIPNVEEFVDNDVFRVGPPWWNWHALDSEWSLPDAPSSRAKVSGTGNYKWFFDILKQQRQTSGKYILVTVYGSHFEKAYFARGIENFLADMAGEPAFARKFLNRIIEKNLVMLENILSAEEVDGVLLGSDWGSQLDLLMSPDTWKDMIQPGEQREYDLIHEYGKDVWIHSCGNIERLIPTLIEMGVDVLNPVQPEAMDLKKLKENYGKRLTFWGGISTQRALPFGTPEGVRKESVAVRELLSAGGGYIFAPAQEIQNDVPVQNMLALIETAKQGKGSSVQTGANPK